MPPPPQSNVPLSYGVVSIVGALAIAILIAALLYWQRKKIVELIQGRDAFRAITYLAEPLFAIAISVIAGTTDLYKALSTKPTIGTVVGGLGVSICATLYIGSKVFAAWAKEKEKEQIAKLNTEIQEAARQASVLERQRDHAIKVNSFVGEIVHEKLERLVVLANRESITPEELMVAWGPKEQLQFIINMIWQFFNKDLPMGSRLRVGIYTRDSGDPRMLIANYGYDGKSRDCFAGNYQDHMRLDAPGNSYCIVVQAFRSDEVIVISSCDEEEKAGRFRYFSEKQRGHLKSMLAYKHIYSRDGSNDALVLTIDTDKDHFFGGFDPASLKVFFVEMMKRFEYELAGVVIHAKLQNAAGPNPN